MNMSKKTYWLIQVKKTPDVVTNTIQMSN